MTDTAHNLGVLLFVPYRAMEAAVLSELKAHGHDLPLSQARVFQRIDPTGGSRMSSLAESAQLSKQTLSSIVDQLERRGYVLRTPDPADARARLVTITPLGRSLIDLSRPIVERVEQEWAARLGSQKLDQLRALLTELGAASEPAAAERRS
jgi:DNA-binding MarR family transcriptional regulator